MSMLCRKNVYLYSAASRSVCVSLTMVSGAWLDGGGGGGGDVQSENAPMF